MPPYLRSNFALAFILVACSEPRGSVAGAPSQPPASSASRQELSTATSAFNTGAAASVSAPAPSAHSSEPRVLGVGEALASDAKDGDEIEVQGVYVHSSLQEVHSPGERESFMELSDDQSRRRVLFCHAYEDPGVRSDLGVVNGAHLGDLVTVRGNVHRGLLNPCVVEAHRRPNK